MRSDAAIWVEGWDQLPLSKAAVGAGSPRIASVSTHARAVELGRHVL